MTPSKVIYVADVTMAQGKLPAARLAAWFRSRCVYVALRSKADADGERVRYTGTFVPAKFPAKRVSIQQALMRVCGREARVSVAEDTGHAHGQADGSHGQPFLEVYDLSSTGGLSSSSDMEVDVCGAPTTEAVHGQVDERLHKKRRRGGDGSGERVPAQERDPEGAGAGGSRRSLPQAVRWQCWNSYIGEDKATGQCWCCKRRISMQAFDCGHVVARARGGSDAVANLRPVCRACNASMATMSMDAFMNTFGMGPPPA
jgi:5-methylcytosine-specific restriction endonuclease McrA